MAKLLVDWVRTHPRAIDHFQVFGERRTGTNFVNQLLSDNLRAETTTSYGWKHGFPTMPVIGRSALIVVVVRDPLSWLSSLHNRPFAVSHEGLGFSEFLRTEWFDRYKPKDFGHARWGYAGMPRDQGTANQIDRHPLTGKRFRNPLEMRWLKTAGFLGFLERECNAVVVDYGTVKEAPEKVVTALRETFELQGLAKVAVPPRVGALGTDRPRIAAADIGAEDRKFIAAELDAAQEARLGYSLTVS